MGSDSIKTKDLVINDETINEINDNYVLETVNIDNILEDLNLSETDTAITKSIILNMEEEIAKGIKENIVVGLPNMGTIQRDYFKDLLKAHNKELQSARANMTKEEYKDYVKEIRRTLKIEAKETYNKRKVYEKFKRGKSKEYNKLAFKRGKAYADLYVKSLLWLKSVDYDASIQEQYDRINGLI